MFKIFLDVLKWQLIVVHVRTHNGEDKTQHALKTVIGFN